VVPSHDTIYALSSGVVPAGIAVVRVSGPAARDAVLALCGVVPPARMMRLVEIRGADGSLIDNAMVVYFPGPGSFTGEDCAEFHLHGSRAVVSTLQQELAARDGFRLAEPGEFTLRAFRNGRVDLTEAEALSDLISAETELQRQFALEQGAGRLRGLYEGWRAEIVDMMAMSEAAIDFADEEAVPDEAGADLAARAEELAGRIEAHLTGSKTGEVIREGFRVVLVGAPNAGKSSLLNRIAGREVAIVTHEAGTTRDVLTVDLDLGGILVRLFDTAGLREAEGLVERIGVQRSLEEARRADLVLEIQDMQCPATIDLPEIDAPVIRVGNKRDLVSAPGKFDVAVSATTGQGLDKLLELIQQHARDAVRHNELVPARQRHVELLGRCLASLRRIDPGDEVALRVENLRMAATALGRITGQVDVEDLLDVIFSRFCIGK